MDLLLEDINNKFKKFSLEKKKIKLIKLRLQTGYGKLITLDFLNNVSKRFLHFVHLNVG